MTKDSHAYEYAYLKERKPLLAFSDEISFSDWQKESRDKLTELLGLPLEQCDPCLTIESTEELPNRTEYYFTVQTEPGYLVPCWLFIPADNPKVPLTVCLSGHGGGMHLAAGKVKTEEDRKALEEWPHRAMGLRAIRDGRCALIVEARNFGEASLNGYGTSCTEAGKIALLMGRTILGERVWDVMRILDAVIPYFNISPENIVCTGNSGGGTATFYLACIDERIAVAAPSCAVCTYEASIAAMPHCLCNHIPSIRKYFEMADLAGLIAPRKLIIAAGEKDSIFPIHGVRQTYETVQRIYQTAGVPNNCALVVGNSGHFNYADLIWEKLHQMQSNPIN